MGSVVEQRSAVLAGQKRALELAIQGAPVREILDVMVRAIEAHSADGMIASIQLVVDGRLRHGAAPGLPDAYNQIVDGIPVGLHQGSCGTAAYLGQIVSVADISTDPRWAPYKDIASRYGLAACWSMPIRSPEGDIVGTFAHYYTTPRDPTPRDVEAVEWIANTAGLVLARELQSARRRTTEAALGTARGNLERQVEGLHLIHELAVGLHAPTELDPMLDLALDTAIRVHQAKHGLLFLFDEHGELQIVCGRGFEAVPADQRRMLTQHVAVLSGERWIVADTEQDERMRALRDIARSVGIRAVHRTPIRMRSGKTLGVLVVHLQTPREPTELETQLMDLLARYVADAIERGHSFGEIRTAKESAEQANRAKDEFLAVLGHELRNPLAPISSALHLLDLTTLDERQRAARDVIERQLGHLTRLVDDLLDIARIRQGRIDLQRTTVDVAELIARAVEMTAVTFQQRGQRVVVHAPRGQGLVHGDPTRLAQIISNLLVNAAKYSDVDTTTTVSLTVASGWVEIAVRDQGIGLSAEMLPRVFELFTQEERSLDRAQGGLGLGLAIVRKLVVLHGGNVRAVSDGPGKGSTFTVALPAIERTESRDATLRTPRLRTSEPRKILVVDDNVDIAAMMGELLVEMGHIVEIAHDAHAALSVIPTFSPDVALLDIGLPVMDGFELARKLRASDVPCPFLVAVTGYGRDSDREQAKEAGFDAHLVKPVSIESVLKLIDGVESR